MSRIGFRPSYVQSEQEEIQEVPPMERIETGQEDHMLMQAKKRLLDAKVFMLTKKYTRLSDRGKARKLQDLEFLTLVVAKLS